MDDEIVANNPDRTIFATRFFNLWHRYKNLLFTYWWILLVAVSLCEAIQGLLLWRVPPSFLSVGRMIVNVKLAIPSANMYSEEINNFYGTQVALMVSDSVINRVKLRLQSAGMTLNPAPVDIKVALSSKTSIFILSAVGSDAQYTQAYLQATMEEYINLKRDLLANASDATKSSLLDELAQMASEVEKSKEEVLNYQSSNSDVFLQQNGGNYAAEYLATLNQQLAEHKSELQMLQTLNLDETLDRQQGIFIQPGSTPQTPLQNPQQQPNAVSPQNPDSASSSNPGAAPTDNNMPNMPSGLGEFEVAYLQAKQQILLLKAKRDDLSQFLRPKHPDIIALNEEIASQEKLLEIFKVQSQEQLTNRRHTLELEIKDLESQIEEWNAKAVDTSKKLADYEVLKENYRRLQTMYDQLQATLQTLDDSKGINQESVSIFEPATPAVPAPREIAKHLGMAGLIGLMLGAGILLFLNRLDDRVASFTELEELFDEPVLGQIPLVDVTDKKAGAQILQLDDDRHALVEAHRNLRSALVFKDSLQNHPKCIVITSAIPGDGKSMTAANLAITLAQAGARVLLVDGDLRRGVMHKHFSMAASPGLAEVLSEQCGWSQAVVQTSIPNLYLLPCGTLPRHPGALFVTQAEKFLKEIAGQYDYYLFDTAPIMAADDVSNLAPHVDGLIMVIRAGFTPARIAQAALDLLYLRKVKVIGLVFNAVRPNAGEYYYYRYKEYYTPRSATS
jgi:capsular exopolysaccharide synthesis family protein